MERQGRLYPIGIQTFEKIRVGNYMYIDKNTSTVWCILPQITYS